MRWQSQTSRLPQLVPAEIPIFGFAHAQDVIIELCRSGAVGIWGATRDTPDEIEAGLAQIAAAVDGRPFGVDLVLPSGMPKLDNREAIESGLPPGHREFVDAIRAKYDVPNDGKSGMRSRFVRSDDMAALQLAKVAASPATIVALGVGSPAHAVETLKASGKIVVSLVGAPRHAQKALEAGADIIVAQGADAGGHTGGIGTFSLVPQIVDLAGDVPVLAAGGVATGRHIAAALALGAAGVWTGTVWLATREHNSDPEILRQIIAATVDDTVISRADSGKTMRQVRSNWTEEWAKPGAPEPLGMPQQDILIGDLLGAVDRHRVTALMHTPAGQGVGYITGESTVAGQIRELVDQTDTALARGRTS